MAAHRLIDLRTNARLDIRNIQRQLDKVGTQLDPDYRAQVDAKVAVVQTLIDAEKPDADQFQQALTDMDHATITLAEVAIKQVLTQEGALSDEQ